MRLFFLLSVFYIFFEMMIKYSYFISGETLTVAPLGLLTLKECMKLVHLAKVHIWKVTWRILFQKFISRNFYASEKRLIDMYRNYDVVYIVSPCVLLIRQFLWGLLCRSCWMCLWSLIIFWKIALHVVVIICMIATPFFFECIIYSWSKWKLLGVVNFTGHVTGLFNFKIK